MAVLQKLKVANDLFHIGRSYDSVNLAVDHSREAPVSALVKLDRIFITLIEIGIFNAVIRVSSRLCAGGFEQFNPNQACIKAFIIGVVGQFFSAGSRYLVGVSRDSGVCLPYLWYE